MHPRIRPEDRLPWQTNQIIGEAGYYNPYTRAEYDVVLMTFVAIEKAMVSSKLDQK